MSTDIFNRKGPDDIGVFTADDVTINFTIDPKGLGSINSTTAGSSIYGLLVQQLNAQYQQPIQQIFDVGSNVRAFVAARPRGTCNLTKVVGPLNISDAFINQFGDVCQTKNNLLDIRYSGSCGKTAEKSKGAFHRVLKHCVADSVGMSVQAENMVINEQISIQFASMQYDAAGTPSNVVFG